MRLPFLHDRRYSMRCYLFSALAGWSCWGEYQHRTVFCFGLCCVSIIVSFSDEERGFSIKIPVVSLWAIGPFPIADKNAQSWGNTYERERRKTLWPCGRFRPSKNGKWRRMLIAFSEVSYNICYQDCCSGTFAQQSWYSATAFSEGREFMVNVSYLNIYLKNCLHQD